MSAPTLRLQDVRLISSFSLVYLAKSDPSVPTSGIGQVMIFAPFTASFNDRACGRPAASSAPGTDL
ncbi:MAG TPA: hypothetical protein VGJ20_12535 [Xanthobacteraceae bacterium]